MRNGEKNYDLSSETRGDALRLAREAGFKPHNVHHILPKNVARLYRIDTRYVKNPDNAIALENDFHNWIHETYDVEDYIFLAIALLDIPEGDFVKKGRNPTPNRFQRRNEKSMSVRTEKSRKRKFKKKKQRRNIKSYRRQR